MSYCCSQCSFTAQFESALTMHHQLHHETSVDWSSKPRTNKEKSKTIPRDVHLERSLSPSKESRRFKLPIRSSSATRVFDKLRARICRSKTLFVHPEEAVNITTINDLSAQSVCTSKALNDIDLVETLREPQKETFGCHLCSFDADRITVLDRHLLNDHKIGLENLLKLVMAKTKDGLSDENQAQMYGIRQPYYKPADEIFEDGEFVIETITPKIKILKHAFTNTDLKWTDIPDLEDNCKKISREIEKIIDAPAGDDKEHFLMKMQTLSECMSKFVTSSNALKKVLTKEFSQKNLNKINDRSFFDLGLGEPDSPRDWERAHSEKIERNRSRHGESRSEKMKCSSESFYF